MEHPPKQGLKLGTRMQKTEAKIVLMEHPPKQGLKLLGNEGKERKQIKF